MRACGHLGRPTAYYPLRAMNSALTYSPSEYDSYGQDESRDPQLAQLRVPPHSIESESSVLGGLLLDNNAWDRVGDLLKDGDFYRYEHKLIYAAIGGLIKNPWKPVVPTASPERS